MTRRRPFKRNDVNLTGPLASRAVVQVDDAVFGSYGLEMPAAGGTGLLWGFDGVTWRPLGEVVWNAKRGRLEALPGAARDLKAALEHSVLQLEQPRTELWVALHHPNGFHGRGEIPRDLSTEAQMLVELARAEACLFDKQPRTNTDTDKAQRLRARYETARDVRRAAWREACGDADRPIAPGSACDTALNTVQSLAPSCGTMTVQCPRKIDRQTRSDWRMGVMPAIGPYEMVKDHHPGADPCCFYHPITQSRIRFQERVGEGLEPQSPAWVARVREAEAQHSLAAVWSACDAKARAEIGALETGHHAGQDGEMHLAKALYEAISRGDDGEALALVGRLGTMFLDVDYEDIRGLEAHFWDPVHQSAHDMSDPKWVRWAHRAIDESMGPGAADEYHKSERVTSAPKRARSSATAAPHIVVTLADAKGRQRMVAAYPSRGKQYRVGVRSVTPGGGHRRVGPDRFVEGLDGAEKAVERLAAQQEREGWRRG